MTVRIRVALGLVLALAVLLPASPAAPASAAPTPSGVRLHLVLQARGLSQPVGIVSARDGTGRLFVVEKTGRIRVRRSNGQFQAAPYLDISNAISSAGERGLLGLAFEPDFRHHPYLWIVFSMPNGTLNLSRYVAAGYTAPTINRTTGRVLMTIPHPATNHNGGQLVFGTDGYLYWSVGDGANPATAQDTRLLTGKILRLNVRSFCGRLRYCIPPANPFATSATARHEVWLWGLRNPWRMSVDRATGRMWIGDVGASSVEEVDVIAQRFGGGNLGWSCWEGRIHNDTTKCIASATYQFPYLVYSHATGQSITGGFVYNGTRYASVLKGLYVFGDFSTGKLWTYQFQGTAFQQGSPFGANQLTSFGEDAAGELWATTIGGRLFQLTATAA